MTHYVCPICGGKADHPKNCDTKGCSREGKPLMECHCEDDAHEEVKGGQE